MMIQCVTRVRSIRIVENLKWFHQFRSFHKNRTPPDNAPTLNENDEWLNQLNRNSCNDGFIQPTTIRNPFKSYKSAKRITFDITETSGKYGNNIKVTSALSNFSSMNYLKQLNRKNNRKQLYRQGNFQDTKIIYCRSGSGGDGCVSFFRDANRRVGPPDGGDGGHGGNIYIQAVKGLNSLTKLSTRYVAPDGQPGRAGQLDGAKGKDILIKVPVGSTIRWCMNPKLVRNKVARIMGSYLNMSTSSVSLKDALKHEKVTLDCIKTDPRISPSIKLLREYYSNCESGSDLGNVSKDWIFKDKPLEYHMEKQWFVDLNDRMKQYDRNLMLEERMNDVFPLYGIDLGMDTTGPIRLLNGGQGGLGNMHFLTSMIRNPRFAKRGRPGLECWFLVELKIIADIGLIGFPNAGKSTILNRISNARPKIGHWEFTTLTPSIGTVSPGATAGLDDTFTVADIPGIVKDAHLDRGMGLEFLKHIERSKCWCFVLSLASEDPLQDFTTLLDEVGGIENVNKRNVLVVANKADLARSPNSVARYEKLSQFCNEYKWDILPISALENHNIDLLIHKMKKCVTSM